MKSLLIAAMAVLPLLAFEFNTEMKPYMDELAVAAKSENQNFKGFSAANGEKIFTAVKQKNGKPVSCTSCHGDNLTLAGENSKTGKKIDPLAPSVNKSRLTSIREVKKWLRRNFNDVYGHEGSAAEKGDVLTYISGK